jgi:hypothetical protein
MLAVISREAGGSYDVKQTSRKTLLYHVQAHAGRQRRIRDRPKPKMPCLTFVRELESYMGLLGTSRFFFFGRRACDLGLASSACELTGREA